MGLSHIQTKKELDLHPTVQTSRLVNNIYVLSTVIFYERNVYIMNIKMIKWNLFWSFMRSTEEDPLFCCSHLSTYVRKAVNLEKMFSINIVYQIISALYMLL
jgi:hypothetical protein